MQKNKIIQKLPYATPFLFVDELLHINEDEVQGANTFPQDSFFYAGHFKNNPVTPGVILTECCAQIGLVCLGIYIVNKEKGELTEHIKIGLSSSKMEFFIPVYPGEKVVVTSKKVYFRFNKLKCDVKMHNTDGKLVCKGTISGMLKHSKDA